jgi:glycosyltransferase involved in cell wall biosynthesis
MILSICIPTVNGRENQIARLLTNLNEQIKRGDYAKKVEIIVEKDNKEMSVGAKRQLMYTKAKGEYSVQIDDDDNVAYDYLETIMEAFKEKPDCVGYVEHCVMDGKEKLAAHSRQCPGWMELKAPDSAGYSFYRTPYFKDPIRTEICQKVGVADKRFGEDHDFSIRAVPFLKTEVFIPRIMYYYEARSMSKQQLNERYGIHPK